jgi:hypothetical protein
LLELPWGAPETEIRQAFRRLALEYHPDRNPGDVQAEARFKLISAAFQRLKGAGFSLPRPASRPPAHAGQPRPQPPRWTPTSSWGARTYLDDDKDEWEPPPRPDFWPDGARIHYPSPEEIQRLVRDLQQPSALAVLRPWGDRLLQGAIYAYFGAIGIAVAFAAALAISRALAP